MKHTLLATAALTLWAGTALADAFTDGVVAKFQEMGFTFIEVKDGPTQVKVEGIKGSTQLEVIYDRATGRILKQEQHRAEAENVGRSGVQIDSEDRDFLADRSGRRHGSDHDDGEDDHGHGSNSGSGSSNSGSGSHDDDDDDSDDDNSGSGSSNSGHGSGGKDD